MPQHRPPLVTDLRKQATFCSLAWPSLAALRHSENMFSCKGRARSCAAAFEHQHIEASASLCMPSGDVQLAAPVQSLAIIVCRHLRGSCSNLTAVMTSVDLL